MPKTQAHRLIVDWLGLVKPKVTGEDRVPSPDHNSFRTSTNPTNRGRKRRPPRSISPRTVCIPQRHWLVADWLGFVKPAHPGMIGSHPWNGNLPYIYSSNILGTKTVIPPVWKHRPQWLIADRPGLVKPAEPGDDMFLSLDQKYFHTSTNPANFRRQRRCPPGRHRPARCGNFNPIG